MCRIALFQDIRQQNKTLPKVYAEESVQVNVVVTMVVTLQFFRVFYSILIVGAIPEKWLKY